MKPVQRFSAMALWIGRLWMVFGLFWLSSCRPGSDISDGSLRSTSAAVLPTAVQPVPVPTAFADGSELVANQAGEHQEYSGVGRLSGSLECTGVFVRTLEEADSAAATPAAAEARAYLLTSARCAYAWNPNEVIRERSLPGMQIVFNNFHDTPNQQLIVPVRKIVYAARRGTDLAILELELKFSELLQRGILPLTLSRRLPRAGQPVEVVGISTVAPAFLRAAKCMLEAPRTVLEGSWLWSDLYPHTCLESSGGSFGAPVVAGDSGAILALVSSLTFPGQGQPDCSLGRPCQVSLESWRTVENTSYASSLAGLFHCFDARGNFDLDLSGCPLSSADGFTTRGTPTGARRPYTLDEAGEKQFLTWNTLLSSDRFTHYRYKAGRVGPTDCNRPEGYSTPISLQRRSFINDPISAEDGFYILCLLAGSSPDPASAADWQSLSSAASWVVQVDATAPTLVPQVSVEDFGEAFRLVFHYRLPELSTYLVKAGDSDTTRCQDLEGYLDVRRLPFVLPRSAAPYKVCVIAQDQAGNPGVPLELPVGK